MDKQIISDRHCCELITNYLLARVFICLLHIFRIDHIEKKLIGTMGERVMAFYVWTGSVN